MGSTIKEIEVSPLYKNPGKTALKAGQAMTSGGGTGASKVVYSAEVYEDGKEKVIFNEVHLFKNGDVIEVDRVLTFEDQEL